MSNPLSSISHFFDGSVYDYGDSKDYFKQTKGVYKIADDGYGKNTRNVENSIVYRVNTDSTKLDIGENYPVIYQYGTNTEITPKKFAEVDDSIYGETKDSLFKYVSGYLDNNNYKSYTIAGKQGKSFNYDGNLHYAFSFPENRTLFFLGGGNGGYGGSSGSGPDGSYIGGSGGSGGQVTSFKINYVANEKVSIDVHDGLVKIYVSNDINTSLFIYGIANGRNGKNAEPSNSSMTTVGQPTTRGYSGFKTEGTSENYGGYAAPLIINKQPRPWERRYDTKYGEHGGRTLVRLLDNTIGNERGYIYEYHATNNSVTLNNYKVNYKNVATYTKEIHNGGKGGDSGYPKRKSRAADSGSRGSFSLYYPAYKNTFGTYTMDLSVYNM